jgi:uncharacterized RDD family membrane protein YckC
VSDVCSWTREGVGGFGRRFGAVLLDALLYGVAFSGAVVLLALVGAGDAVVLTLLGLGGPLGFLVYDGVMTGIQGATFGKRLLGLQVRGADGRLPGSGRAWGRAFARILSAMPFGLGYLWAAWDPRGQTWHDSLSGTYVVQVSALRPAAAGPQTAVVQPWPGQPQPSAPPQPMPVGQAFGTGPPAGWSSPAGPPPAAWTPPAGGTSAAPGPQAWAVGEAPDPNLVAIARAGLRLDTSDWLQQIAEQVGPRLDAVAPGWREEPHAEAAAACAFGLILGHLSLTHPHVAADLGRVAEVHPSFTTLLAGSRLPTLQQLVTEPPRMAAWLGPLVGVDDPGRIGQLLR